MPHTTTRCLNKPECYTHTMRHHSSKKRNIMNIIRYSLLTILISTFNVNTTTSSVSYVSPETVIKAGSFLLSEGKELFHAFLAVCNCTVLLNFANSSAKGKTLLMNGVKSGEKNDIIYAVKLFAASPKGLYKDDNNATQDPRRWGIEAIILLLQSYLAYHYVYKKEILKPFSDFCVQKGLKPFIGDWKTVRTKYPILARTIEEIPTTLVVAIVSTMIRHVVGDALRDEKLFA